MTNLEYNGIGDWGDGKKLLASFWGIHVEYVILSLGDVSTSWHPGAPPCLPRIVECYRESRITRPKFQNSNSS